LVVIELPLSKYISAISHANLEKIFLRTILSAFLSVVCKTHVIPLAYIGSNAYEIYQIDRFFLQHEFGALVSFVNFHEAGNRRSQKYQMNLLPY